MDLERALVSKIVFTGQVESVIGRSITSEHFADDECRDVYEYILGHTRKYKSAPSLEAAKHDNPDFEWLQIQDPLEFLLDRFVVLVKRRMANDMLVELAEACDDSKRAENIDLEFVEISRKLITALPSAHIDRFSEVEKRIREYDKRKKEGKLQGIQYGYPTLDRMTGGILPHELVTVLGFTNAGKSTLLRSLAVNFWLKGFSPLYISLEMEANVILEIFDAMVANLDYAKMRQLALENVDMKNWRRFAKEFKNRNCDISVIDSSFRITPDQVYAETLRHKPDVVIIDYVGLMKSTSVSRGISKYQQLSEITQDLKINARMLRVPIIMAAQTNRGGAKDGAELENVADAISIAQDSDTVIGLFQDEEMAEQKIMELRLNKNRLGPRGKLKAVWNYENMEFRERTGHDMFNRENGNDDGEKKKEKAPHQKRRIGKVATEYV